MSTILLLRQAFMAQLVSGVTRIAILEWLILDPVMTIPIVIIVRMITHLFATLSPSMLSCLTRCIHTCVLMNPTTRAVTHLIHGSVSYQRDPIRPSTTVWCSLTSISIAYETVAWGLTVVSLILHFNPC